MKRISVFLAEPQVDAFRQLASESGRPSSELIREALDLYLRDRLGSGSLKKKTDRKRAATRKRP